jgi:NTE family protein
LKKTSFKNQPLGLAMLEITGKNMGVSRLEHYPVDFFIQAILRELNRLLDENLTLLDNPKIIGTFLTPSNSSFLRYNFITFYIVFLSIRGDLSPERMSTFLSKFSPDIALSMITVFYIHEIINH